MNKILGVQYVGKYYNAKFIFLTPNNYIMIVYEVSDGANR
jgi:hypothetical protein